MTKSEKNILLAFSLGDGHLRKDRNTLQIQHCLRQKELIEWKANILSKIFRRPVPIRYFNNSGFPALRLEVSDRYFRILRRYVYKNGIKHIRKSLLDRLGAVGLAVWIMDDGSLIAKKRNGKTHAFETILSTYCSEEEAIVMVKWFFDKYKIPFTIKHNKGKCCVRTGTHGSKMISEIVKLYMLPSMQYKVLS